MRQEQAAAAVAQVVSDVVQIIGGYRYSSCLSLMSSDRRVKWFILERAVTPS